MQISDTGVVIEPSATAVLEAQQILIDTYGPTVNLNEVSPNGQLVQNEALAITMRESDQANIVNAMNPNIATGLQLDAICANLNIERIAATQSSATCIFTGLAGVTIPVNTQVASSGGDVFYVESTLVIGIGGTITGSVLALEVGAVPSTANTITKILQGISGWDTVNNPANGTIGQPEQNDVQFRKTRVDRLAFASTGSYQSILAGAATLNPVSYYLVENDDPGDILRDGIPILGNSVLLILDGGGSDLDVATMLYKRKSAGCRMSGSETFTILIPGGEPFVAHWEIAARKALGIHVRLKLGSVYPPNLEILIANVINTKFNFNVIGQYIEATEFVYLLIGVGIQPIRSLTFSVGAITDLTEYTMPISDSLGDSLLSSNVVVEYV